MCTTHPESGHRYKTARRLCTVECECGNVFIMQTYKFKKERPANCGCDRNKYSDEELFAIARKYTNLTTFIQDEINIYTILGNRSLRKKACKHMEGTREQFKALSKVKGIYFLYKGPEIVYIGKSTYCIADRLSSHLHGNRSDSKKDFDKVVAYEILNYTDMHVAEVYLINRHTPKYNKDAVGSESLTLMVTNLDTIINSEITVSIA